MERKWCKGLVMEYTDLELNKMIAELEGYKPVIVAEMVKTNDSFNYAPIESQSNKGTHNYNKNRARLFDLMVKYKVYIDHIHGACFMWHSVDGDIVMKTSSKFKSESEIPRAIITCILKSKNII